MKILCIGQSAYDITLPVNSYPIENQKYKINGATTCGGGSCNNAAYLLALWGNEVYLASPIGKDDYGKRIKEELVNVGVKLDYLEELDIPTTTSYIINNLSNGSRTIITNKHQEMTLPKDKKIEGDFDVIFVDGNDYELAIEVIQKYPQAIKILDAGGFKEGTKELCSLCDYLVCSNDFLREYAKINFRCSEIEKVKEAYDLLQKDFKGLVITTLEEQGSLTKIDEKFYHVPSIKVNSVDTTGAGDIFHGALTHFIIHKYPLIDAMHYANITGALSVTKIGSKNSMPKLSEVLKYHEL